jgi:hypothetical protein
MPRTSLLVPLVVALGLSLMSSAAATQPPGEEACVTSEVEGASGRLCARRDGFGAAWTAELTDTADDDRRVKARVGLDVEAGRDATAELEGDTDGAVVRESGRLGARIGSSLRSVSIETCVDVRFGRDRCDIASVALPQLPGGATPAQRERLDELIFELPVADFIEVWSAGEREGVDATFDWSSDGCSAGPFRELFDERMQQACIRHDFAYRNLGQMGLVPTDEVRRRVDAQLAADIAALEQGLVTGGFETTLQRFGGPVYYGEDLATLWGVPDFIVTRLGTPELRDE